MQVRVVPFDSPDAVKLIAEVQQEYVNRYGDVDRTPLDPAEFAPPAGIFLVGYLDGVPVACGGWRAHDGWAELKRMYVVASARGKGLARVLLAELERTAAEAGLGRVQLETGQKQPEAIGLYSSSGYHRIQGFGYYRDHPGSVCFGKELG